MQHLLTSIEVQLGHLKSICFTVSATKAEDYDRLELSLHDHLHN